VPTLRVVISLLLCLGLGRSEFAGPQSTKSVNTPASCRKFVQAFYDWYARRAFKENSGWLNSSLAEKPSYFAPELRRALKQYQQAPSDPQADIDNLDFDPFLNAQDTADAYVVENCRRKGDAFLVDVYGVSSGKKHSQPDVSPDLTFRNGAWQFTNFHYPNGRTPESDNLLSILEHLRHTKSP
jgi:hypothetical protein